MVEIRPLTREDVFTLWPELSAHSFLEMGLAHIRSPEELWRVSQKSEHADVGLIDGVPAAAFGVTVGSLASGTATIWMFVGKLAVAHPFAFVRKSQIWLEQLAMEYPFVTCYVSVNAPGGEKWMRLLRMSRIAENDGYVEFRLRTT